MKLYHSQNERIKHEYFVYLKNARQLAPITISSIQKSIFRLEEFTSFKNFRTFGKRQAIEYKAHLQNTLAVRSKKPLTKPTVLNNINQLKSFLFWLQDQPSYKSRIKKYDIDYLNLLRKEVRSAKEPKFKPFPTIRELETVLSAMPNCSDVEKRDKAMLAFIILTGIRDSAVISLKLKHITISRNHVFQDPDEVKTKFSKSINTYFFPVGENIKNIVINWINYLKIEKSFGPEDPLFPKELIQHDQFGRFESIGIQPKHWQKGDRTRKNFKFAFENVGLPYYNPHRIRDTLAHLGQQLCTTPEEFKAWSQNLGHANTLTTFTSYGEIDPHSQGEIIHRLGHTEKKQDDLGLILARLNKMENK